MSGFVEKRDIFKKSWNCDVLSNVKRVHIHENGNFVTLFGCEKNVKVQIIGFYNIFCLLVRNLKTSSLLVASPYLYFFWMSGFIKIEQ